MAYEPNRRVLSLAAALGVLGAAVLVLSHMFFAPGKFILIPYAAVILGSLLAIRAERLPSFWHRFMVGFIAFMLSSVALSVAVLSSRGASDLGVLGVAGVAWRIAFMTLVGAAINIVTARLSSSPVNGTALVA